MAQLTLGVKPDKSICFIEEVPGGINCGCFCPICGSLLIAKQGAVNEWHFAHEAGQERPECEVGAHNLFCRLMFEHLIGYASLTAIAGLPNVTIQQISDAQDNCGLAKLSDGRSALLLVKVDGSSQRPNSEVSPKYLLYRCVMPASDTLRNRTACNTYISSHARLYWHGAIAQREQNSRAERSNKPQQEWSPGTVKSVKRFDTTLGANEVISVYSLMDRTNWIMYKNPHNCFVLRPWPIAHSGWESRVSKSVGTLHIEDGAYEIKDFLAASYFLRSHLHGSVQQCRSFESAKRLAR